jgi:hypothetical protein
MFIKNLNGFYGLIGPDIKTDKVHSLFDLFVGNGLVQGVFFDRGNITFVREHIQTKKWLHETKHGKLPTNKFAVLLLLVLQYCNLTPNLFGAANTALLPMKNATLALFERDSPYEIKIDFDTKQIRTMRHIDAGHHYSGHSKYNASSNLIETISYNVLKRTVDYYCISENFTIVNRTTVQMQHFPIVHDFLVLQNNILLCDSAIPICPHLRKSVATVLYLIDKHTFKKQQFTIPHNYYIFHYAYAKESGDVIEIFAPIYENLDFSTIHIHGKYRKLRICKGSPIVEVITNSEVEKYNLDFPVRYKDLVILRNICDMKINGFVFCRELTIVKTVFFENRFICGEPAIGDDKLISFAYDGCGKGYVLFVDLETYETFEIPLFENLTIGFHSIFIENV